MPYFSFIWWWQTYTLFAILPIGLLYLELKLLSFFDFFDLKV